MENLKINIHDLLHKRTLIIGDIGKGKTRITALIVGLLIDSGFKEKITIIDMAPPRSGMVGGKISEYININSIRYFHDDRIRGPRFSAKTLEELSLIAERNKDIIEQFLNHYLNNPTEILIINDLTIYLHKGSTSKIIQCINKSKTFIGNAYSGVKLYREQFKDFDTNESNKLSEIMKIMDNIIKL
ncbi:MAG: hypothetical protein ACP5OK_07625 [Thermoprotei archaeon]